MSENKYSNFLTILLVIIIVVIIGFLAFGAYTVYNQFNSSKEANKFVNSFIDESNQNTNTNVQENTTTDPSEDDPLNQVQSTPGGDGNTSSGGTNSNQTYKGYPVVGTIEIQKTNVSYPILGDSGAPALQVSVAMLVGAGPNKPGNTVIIGHNYRNGVFFANNKNLSIGDKIYITDLSGQRLSYTIYDKFETVMEDSAFITRNTNGAREISLQTCTDDGNLRLIILAKCDLDS